MKEKIILVLAFLLVLPIVSANVTIEQEIHTDGNVEATHNVFAEGWVKLIINGVDLLSQNDSVEVNSYHYSRSSGFAIDTFIRILNRAMIHINTQIKNHVLEGTEYTSYGFVGEIGEIFYSTFMPRWELEYRFKSHEYADDIFIKWVEIKDDFNGTDKDAYCHAKFLVSKEYGFKEITCFGTDIHIDPTEDEGIIIETLE